MKQHARLLLFIRITLASLIAVNLFAIFFFSFQTAEKSAASSGVLTDKVIESTVQNFGNKDTAEQENIRLRYHSLVRRFAHRAEYGSLGALVFLLLLTWKKHLPIKYVASLFAVFVTAGIDEICQIYTDGRSGEFSDVLNDLLGATVTCTAILLVVAITVLVKRLIARKQAEDSI